MSASAHTRAVANRTQRSIVARALKRAPAQS
jgi:hypothetical protein